MGYTTLKNQGRVKEDEEFTLEGAALRFIRERCEGLRFSEEKTKQEEAAKQRPDASKQEKYLGTSLKPNQIPFNMQMDIDRLCLENALDRFLKSGKKEDAFDVYFCYLEMFVGDYEKTRRMIELLSEFEANGSGLLMKHRDHYSHSVYVFALGLAIYESNDIYRKTYIDYYKPKTEQEAAWHYLQYWGLTSLFHDIGYPFELPFEQVASYFEVDGDDRTKRPFVAYHALRPFVELDKTWTRKVAALFKEDDAAIFENTDELFAYVLTKKLGKEYTFSEKQMLGFLQEKPTKPEKFNHYMDHAYFSATILFKKLFCEMECELKLEHLDALSAILLHNSLYKFCVAHYKDEKLNKPLEAKQHPLAYMLMLCDELQCWDRIAYGRNSKRELHPVNCEFDLSGNEIKATYLYDKRAEDDIKEFMQEYQAWLDKKPEESDKEQTKLWKKRKPKMKAFSGMYVVEKSEESEKSEVSEMSDFQKDIELIVRLWKKESKEPEIKLTVGYDLVEVNRARNLCYLSESNFLHLYQFAIVLNGRWNHIDEWKAAKANGEEAKYLRNKENVKKFEAEFKPISLEYKLSNINQAKTFARYADEVRCFYTDKLVAFDVLEKIESEDLLRIGEMEHQRWLQEHYDMGWEYGTPAKEDRDFYRQHWDMLKEEEPEKGEVTLEQARRNYALLGKGEQEKDTEPMECMLALLKMYDGIRFYRLR